MLIFLFLVTMLLLVVLMIACYSAVRGERYMAQLRKQITQQPEISDEEFCKMMPDISPEICLTVRKIISESTGWDGEEIHPKTRLVEFELY